MNALRFLSDERAVLVQAGFFIPLAFLVTYTLWHRWWESVFGRLMFGLFTGLALIGLPTVLGMWHLMPAPTVLQDRPVDWLVTQGRLVIPVAAAGFTWLNWKSRTPRTDADRPIAAEDDTLTLLRQSIPRD